MTLNWLDATIIVLALVIVVMVGLRASRNRDASASDYFSATGKLQWWLIGAGLVGTSVSSEQLVGTIGATYQHGMGISNWEWFTLPVYTLTLVFFIPIYLRNRITTVAEFYRKRFGPLCANIYSWVMLPAYVVVFLVPTLYGGSLAFAGLTGINFYVVLWVMVVLVGLYTVKGGLLSVTWADMVQCTFLVVGGLVLFLVSLNHIPGGWKAMAAAHPERFHLYHPINDPVAPFLGLVLMTFNVAIFYQATNQVMIQRVLGARSKWDGIMGTIWAGFINFVRPCVTSFLGLIVYHWIAEMKMAPPLDIPDKAFPFALSAFAPGWGLRGIVLVGFLAAVMSTVSALSNSIATIFAIDIYQKIVPNTADKKVVRLGQLASALGLIIAALLAPLVAHCGGIFKYFQTAITYLATPFATIFLLGMFWRRMNYAGAVAGLIGGFFFTVVVIVSLALLHIQLHWIYVGFLVQVLIVILVVIVSLCFPPPARPQWEPFRWTPRLLWTAEGEKRPWYKSLILWYGVYAAIWIYIYWRFW